MRDSRFLVQMVVAAALVCVASAVAFALAGGDAALASAVTGCVLIVVFAVHAALRRREIMQLAADIDKVLHASSRPVSLFTCREGDVAVLRNEVEKVVAQLSRTTDQLAYEKSALADAMADVSHQIRTPLTAMALAVYALEEADDALERKRMTRELEQGIDRVSWLVTSLLKMAKIDAGALSVDRQSVNVHSLVEFATRPLAMSFDLREVQLVVECADDVAFTGDMRWCAEALQNVVKNCMEHTPAGGTVTISAHENALATHIEVRDTGCGIAPEDLPHVFERFYRGTHGAIDGGKAEAAHKEVASAEGAGGTASDNAHEGDAGLLAGACDDASARGAKQLAQPEGFGIGLALAQALVSAQGGTISARNAPEGGAVFHIAFPKLVV